jgi:hypothetical protein
MKDMSSPYDVRFTEVVNGYIPDAVIQSGLAPKDRDVNSDVSRLAWLMPNGRVRIRATWGRSPRCA